MLIIHPDHARRIDLPGGGPCPRPVDIDRARTGFEALVSLRIYSFARGVVIDGEAEEDEVFIVLMRGAANIASSRGGREAGTFALRRDAGMRAIYMPPHASYRLSAESDCDIAYARVAGRGTRFPETRGFTPTADWLDINSYALGMDMTLATLRPGQTMEQANGARSGERFVHIRSDDAARVTLAGEPLEDWDSCALGTGESAVLEVGAGTVEVLMIEASAGGSAHAEV